LSHSQSKKRKITGASEGLIETGMILTITDQEQLQFELVPHQADALYEEYIKSHV